MDSNLAGLRRARLSNVCPVQPAARHVGISKRIGWHTVRRTYTTVMHANGEGVKVVQERLRHGSARITIGVYAEVVTPAKRRARESGCTARGREKEVSLKKFVFPLGSRRKRGF